MVCLNLWYVVYLLKVVGKSFDEVHFAMLESCTTLDRSTPVG